MGIIDKKTTLLERLFRRSFFFLFFTIDRQINFNVGKRVLSQYLSDERKTITIQFILKMDFSSWYLSCLWFFLVFFIQFYFMNRKTSEITRNWAVFETFKISNCFLKSYSAISLKIIQIHDSPNTPSKNPPKIVTPLELCKLCHRHFFNFHFSRSPE